MPYGTTAGERGDTDLLRNRLASLCLLLAGVNGAVAIAAGAYSRHSSGDAYGREVLTIAADYQLGHALALLGLACLAEHSGSGVASPAGAATACFALGIILFSGTLYALGITGNLPVEGAAPAGGLFLILGWLIAGSIGARSLVGRRGL